MRGKIRDNLSPRKGWATRLREYIKLMFLIFSISLWVILSTSCNLGYRKYLSNENIDSFLVKEKVIHPPYEEAVIKSIKNSFNEINKQLNDSLQYDTIVYKDDKYYFVEFVPITTTKTDSLGNNTLNFATGYIIKIDTVSFETVQVWVTK